MIGKYMNTYKRNYNCVDQSKSNIMITILFLVKT